ncbi:uncharacterized protein LOC110426024 [Herrania umbratica]|uniref:Uncharacterized protein LOC110426024 n=1 Tax=Herrania umbratica TaxID=108875 RepID=A0A6J1BBN7_9ROSI|nr:uncharacterized protein LOC110426024 [Herrania umbratica]
MDVTKEFNPRPYVQPINGFGDLVIYYDLQPLQSRRMSSQGESTTRVDPNSVEEEESCDSEHSDESDDESVDVDNVEVEAIRDEVVPDTKAIPKVEVVPKITPNVEVIHDVGVDTDGARATQINPHASSSIVLEHRDSNSASSTQVAHTEQSGKKVDFHGFQILLEYTEYLKHVFNIEGEFWSTSFVKNVDVICLMMAVMDRALGIFHAPLMCTSSEESQQMLQDFDDACNFGFKLECLSDCRSKAKIFLNKSSFEKELEDIATKIASMKKCEAEIREQLDVFANNNSSLWSM